MKRSNRGRQVNETTPLTQAEEHDDVEDKIPWLQVGRTSFVVARATHTSR